MKKLNKNWWYFSVRCKYKYFNLDNILKNNVNIKKRFIFYGGQQISVNPL